MPSTDPILVGGIPIPKMWLYMLGNSVTQYPFYQHNVYVCVHVSSLNRFQVYLHSGSVCSYNRVSFTCRHSCHYIEKVHQSSVFHLLLPEPIHPLPLVGDFYGVWGYNNLCGLGSEN